MKSNTPLLKTLLVAAATSLSFYATPAWATDLPTSAPSDSSPQASNGVIATGDYAIASGATQGWISPNGAGTGSIGSYNISFGEGTTFSGSGLFGIYFVQGSGETVETVDLTNVTAYGLSGQLIVLNNWNNDTTVKILGETWSDVEYIFANAVDDTELAAKYGLTDYSRGALDSDFASKGLNDTLALQDNTTLAGVTGASKGVTIYDSTGASEVLCNHEYITVTSEGTTLTIAGSGTYGFYGTVGADTSGSVVRASIVMNSSDGSGSQTFGGTNYLADVTVTSGTLALGGTTDISGAVTVASGSTLDLSGTITLGSAITNSGTVVVDSDVVFVLDNLTPSNDTTYTIISGTGSIQGWDSLDYTNFGLESARQLTSSSNGTITVDTTATAQNLTWAGTSGSTWNSGVSTNTVWTNNTGGGSDYFVNGDNVTFSGSGTDTVTISGNVEAGTMTVSSGNYTFTASTGNTLTVNNVSVTGSDTITFTGGGEFSISDYEVEDYGSTNGASLAVGENTTVTIGDYHARWHQGTTTLSDGAVLNITTQMWFSTNSTEELTGGTFNIQQLTISNATTIVSVHDAVLNIGSGDGYNGGLKNDGTGYFIFGDNLTVGVYAGTSGTNTGWSTTAEIQFTKGEGTGTTFSTNAGETITLGGSLTGVGFTNTGEGTLILSGTVALDSAIINSGNIVLNADTVSIAVDSLTAGTYNDTTSYYEIITGSGSGTVTFENGSSSNFTINGSTLSSSWNIYTTDGYLVIYRSSDDLTWAGTADSYTWNYTDENWSDGATFSEGDNVTFGTIEGSISGTVDITTDIKAGSITVEDDYTFTTTVEGGVTVDAGGDLKVAENKTLTIDEGVTLYIDFEESDFSVEGKIAGSGTIEIDLTGNTYASTVNLGDGNEFAGTVYIHSGEFHLAGSNIGNGTYRLGDGVNIEIATSGVSVSNDFIIEGTTELHINSGSSLTISGSISGVETEGTMGGSFDRQGAGSLEISGNVDIGTFTIDTTGSNASSTTTFSGSSVKIGALNVVYADSVIFSSTTTTIGSLTFSAAGTVTFNSDATITGNIAFTAASGEALVIGAGATLTVGGNITDTDANKATNAHITLGEGSTLNVAGAISVAPGGAANYYTQIAGQGADKSTVIAGSFQLGDASTGGAFEVNGATFITGGISFGTAGSSNFNLYLKDATLGFTQDVTIAPTGTSGSTSRFVLGSFVGNSSETGTGTTTTINTSKYDTEAGDFTNEGVTVTISQVISGHGALVVTGNGSLTLSAANTFDGGLTIDAGKVIAEANSALGTGTVTIENGGQLSVDSGVTISNNINIILSTENMSNSASPTSLVVTLAAAGDTDVYALIGSGSIADSVTITITVDEAVAQLLAAGGEYTFDIYEGVTLASGVTIDATALEAYGTVSWNQGVLTIVSDIPEPELFSIFFGLGAIGLVATRRRRRR